jgi:guanosine-3',5'-bis(diphosphate) 3'-pyrophosphohydrolase
MKEWIAVLRAADTAARWHVHQRRKGIAQEPYINHLLEVASLVSEATSGSDPTVVIAALLHDAVEDQEVPVEMIAREFGKQVADIVMEVTDDKTLPKDERKRQQIETAPKKSREAKLIKLADKTGNLRAIASSPAADWSVILLREKLLIHPHDPPELDSQLRTHPAAQVVDPRLPTLG